MKAKMYNKTVWELIKYNGGPVNGTQHVMNINVEVTQDYSLVSLVTMIAPSPDWFTGIMQMDLCDSSTGMWRDSWNVTMLHPWDAGTDDGNTFLKRLRYASKSTGFYFHNHQKLRHSV